jgi:hypothetical protein
MSFNHNADTPRMVLISAEARELLSPDDIGLALARHLSAGVSATEFVTSSGWRAYVFTDQLSGNTNLVTSLDDVPEAVLRRCALLSV